MTNTPSFRREANSIEVDDNLQSWQTRTTFRIIHRAGDCCEVRSGDLLPLRCRTSPGLKPFQEEACRESWFLM
jgi:hypothetical protein